MRKFMRIKALKAAFPATIPIFTGVWFLGMAYGIYMNASGFSFIYPLCMSLLIYGGSLEFVAVEMLLSPFAPLQTFIMALLIQARHSRTDLHSGHRRSAYLEAPDADLHCWRHHLLHAANPLGTVSITFS